MHVCVGCLHSVTCSEAITEGENVSFVHEKAELFAAFHGFLMFSVLSCYVVLFCHFMFNSDWVLTDLFS